MVSLSPQKRSGYPIYNGPLPVITQNLTGEFNQAGQVCCGFHLNHPQKGDLRRSGNQPKLGQSNRRVRKNMLTTFLSGNERITCSICWLNAGNTNRAIDVEPKSPWSTSYQLLGHCHSIPTAAQHTDANTNTTAPATSNNKTQAHTHTNTT